MTTAIVVGEASEIAGRRLFCIPFQRKARCSDLGALEGWVAAQQGINNAGPWSGVPGLAIPSGFAFMYENGQMRWLGSPVGQRVTQTQ